MTDGGGEKDLAQAIEDTIQRYWGFDELRPLQAEAIAAGVKQRDSLVVMPTGGGKSLCYQIPPLVMDRLDVVVSPLISLMKDQVDGLRASGYPAAALHSNLSSDERRDVMDACRAGRIKLLFVSPERLANPGFQTQLRQLGARAFAIDEAHCISHWGHDFRPEYRQLAELRGAFPDASFHAYTATATPRVQQDIAAQLGLRDPHIVVGSPDRPNLTYRIVPRTDTTAQVLEVLARHVNEAVIVYAMTRKETESLAGALIKRGIQAAFYHAGMSAAERSATQEAFATERLDVVVATVAFGMGIDRSNVRCVIHVAMPKSIEHYQQETGRAGRDGLEAECVLLHSAADVIRWEQLMQRSAEESSPEEMEAQTTLLRHMQGLCRTAVCRHRALVEYFGGTYDDGDACSACDVCLDEVDVLPDSTEVARKILSGVARLEQRWGVGRVVQVLRGATGEAITRAGQDRLSVYGLLRQLPERTLTNLVYQLVDQGLIGRTPGDRPVLTLTDDSMPVLRGEATVRLIAPRAATETRDDGSSWEGVDRPLFEALRGLRRELADERAVPPYVIFGDAALRALARERPSNPERMRHVKGVGEKKLADFGPRVIDLITRECAERDLPMDRPSVVVVQASTPRAPRAPRGPRGPSPAVTKAEAWSQFSRGASIARVVEATGRTSTTVVGYLADWIREERPERVDDWVDDVVYEQVEGAIEAVGTDRLKPIFEHLGGAVDYETIRVVIAHVGLRSAESATTGE